MTDNTALGDRMKRYESVTRAVLPRRTYTILRLDGRAFHTFLRHADKPVDKAVIAAMDETARALCTQIQGAQFAYTQSDEISVLMTDFETVHTEPWFGGVVQKIVSVAASIAAVAFNQAYSHPDGIMATFDARVFTIPDPVEVANYFVWRQRDCVRNSISAVAQTRFSVKELHGKNTDQMQEMLLREHGINWAEFPAEMKRGRVVTHEYEYRPPGEKDTPLVKRSFWDVYPAPHFTAEPNQWLSYVIPPLPSLIGRTHGH